MKPGDRYAIPLCATCHAKQHRISELSFWSTLRIDPLNVALRLWTVSADLKAGSALCFARDNGSIWRSHMAEDAPYVWDRFSHMKTDAMGSCSARSRVSERHAMHRCWRDYRGRRTRAYLGSGRGPRNLRDPLRARNGRDGGGD